MPHRLSRLMILFVWNLLACLNGAIYLSIFKCLVEKKIIHFAFSFFFLLSYSLLKNFLKIIHHPSSAISLLAFCVKNDEWQKEINEEQLLKNEGLELLLSDIIWSFSWKYFKYLFLWKLYYLKSNKTFIMKTS